MTIHRSGARGTRDSYRPALDALGVMNAQQLRSIYGEGYFHGVNSGYPNEGYAAVHPVWSHWIQLVKDTRPGAATWLDRTLTHNRCPS